MTADNGRLADTPPTTLKRRVDRGSRDRAVIDAIVDQVLVCHVGFIDEGNPAVMPTCPWRIDDWLYVHGAANSRLLARFSGGDPLCVSLARVDGLVLARSALRHSLHYRSVVLFGRGEAVTTPAAKTTALLALIDKLSPGRSAKVRPPRPEELAATGVARMRIAEGTAKVAASPPGMKDIDRVWPVWDGVVPLCLRAAAPVPMAGAEGFAAPALPFWLA